MSQERHRDPILDPPRKKGISTAWMVGIGVATLVNGGALFYALNEKFKMVQIVYNDDAQKVVLEKLPPPPPPPPKPKTPPPPPKAPPPVQPRVSLPPPPNITPPPPPPFKAVTVPVPQKQNIPTVLAPPAPPAPPAPKRPAVISRPDWIHRPDGSDFVRYYPPQAMERGTEGHATIECTVTESGSLTGCSVASETPSGAGFGSASLRIASKFRMRPQTADGAPVGGARVTIPITWKLAG
jgi:protein TonB